MTNDTATPAAERTESPEVTISEFLATPSGATFPAPGHLWAFSGLHGGLGLATVASVLQRHAPDLTLRSITGQYHRPVNEAFAIESNLIRAGRTTAAFSATATTPSRGTCLTATGIFGSDQIHDVPSTAPAMPQVRPPDRCETFRAPADFVPFTNSIEVRPVDAALPYTSGDVPLITAWIRVLGDDDLRSDLRTIFLLDALPPSYGVMLSFPRPVPTLEFSVHLSPSIEDSMRSPWVLLRAQTEAATSDGWSSESIDAWDESGAHLGSARQLRLTPTMPR